MERVSYGSETAREQFANGAAKQHIAAVKHIFN